MNKLNREITKSIKQIRADMVAKYQKLFNDLKKKGVTVLDDWAWNRPTSNDFKIYGADAKLYVKSLRGYMVTKLNNFKIDKLIDCPDCYVYVTADELKQFETVTYPKLYAEWQENQKLIRAQKRADNAKNADKIRAEIADLQRQLDSIENADC